MELLDQVGKTKDRKGPGKTETPVDPEAPLTPAPLWMQAAILAYVAISMIVDTLAGYQVDYLIDWSNFLWQTEQGADLFKLVAWFLVPLTLCWPLDAGWFSVKRWKKGDLAVLGLILVSGMLAMLLIPHVASLQEMYGGMVDMARGGSEQFTAIYILWIVTWLPGWEFVHRYWMLRAFGADLRSWRWLLIPAYEGLYHLQKPFLEMVGMVLFSLILTSWAIRRRNVLLPFVAHLLVEIDLLLFLLGAASQKP